jgi:hypothetical protein
MCFPQIQAGGNTLLVVLCFVVNPIPPRRAQLALDGSAAPETLQKSVPVLGQSFQLKPCWSLMTFMSLRTTMDNPDGGRWSGRPTKQAVCEALGRLTRNDFKCLGVFAERQLRRVGLPHSRCDDLVQRAVLTTKGWN